MTKTLFEIKTYCKTECPYYEKYYGKYLKRAKWNITFCGITILHKEEYYCNYPRP